MSLFSTQPVLPQLTQQDSQQPPAQNLGFSSNSAPNPSDVGSFAQQAAYGGGSGGGMGSSHAQGARDMLAAHAKDIMSTVLGGLF